MDIPTSVNYNATGRDNTMELEDVHIFSRTGIYGADPQTDEGKINAQIGNSVFIAEQSGHADRKHANFKREIEETMLTDAGRNGGPGTFKCPLMQLGFVNAWRLDFGALNRNEEGGEVTLFEGWDGNIIFTNSKVTAKQLMEKS